MSVSGPWFYIQGLVETLLVASSREPCSPRAKVSSEQENSIVLRLMRLLYVSHSPSLARLPRKQSQEGAPTACETDTSSPSRSALLSEHEVKAREEDESDISSRSDKTIFRFGLAALFVTLLLPALVSLAHPLGSCAFEGLTAAPLAVDQQQQHRSSVGGNVTTISDTSVTSVPQICQAEVRKKGGGGCIGLRVKEGGLPLPTL